MPAPFLPKNRTATEHIGTVDRCVFRSPSGDFAILSLKDGATVLGMADADHFPPKTTWRFLGSWEDNAQRGLRFRFRTAVPHLMHGKTGVCSYLTKSCTGIGEKTAARLWDKYGGEAVELLRTKPEQVAEELGLDADLCHTAAGELASARKHEATRIDLFTLTDRRGFSGAFIEKAIEKWGVHAPRILRRNPFAALGLPSAGYKRCDKLWTDLGLPKDSLKRAGVVAWHIVKNDTAGHTWVRASDLGDRLREAAPGADVVKAFKFALRARKLKKYRDAAGELWLATYPNATAEERIAANVRRLLFAPNLWPTDRVPVSKADGDKLPSEHQVERLRRATLAPLGILIGGPGTGKSHVTAFLLREIVREFGVSNVAACAPTGKAAQRVTQALALAGIDLRAKTIHSTLEIGRNGHDGDGWGFMRNRANPLDAKFIFADETSMDDTTLLADLLDAVPNGGHVLLIGDASQLPPVGHGAPLRDLIDAGVPHGELTQVQRNAGNIVHACVRIKNGESFEVPDEIDLDAKVPKNLKLIQARDEKAQLAALTETLKSFTKFHPVWQTQVIVARNTKGEVCRKKINEVLHPMLNPDGYGCKENPFKVGDKIICTRNGRLQRVEPIYLGNEYMPPPSAITAPVECWHCGSTERKQEMQEFKDKTNHIRESCAKCKRFIRYAPKPSVEPGETLSMAAVASNYEVVRDYDNQPEEVYVANGEIGRVVAVAPKLTVARFSEGEMLVKIPMGRQKDEDEEDGGDGDGGGKGCNFEHAYAMTCHRLQGSEAPCVIVIGDAGASMLCTREWIYTAVSRASKLCVLIGQMSTFDKMRGKVSLNKRKTFLKQMVQDVLFEGL